MHILLVEDNYTIAKGLAYAFAKNGYQLTYQSSIQDAKIYLQKNPNIDCVILDILLPDGDGYAFYINTIKQANIPTIFLTAKEEEDMIVKCLNTGAEDYITKPFRTNELLARVQKILFRHQKESKIYVKSICFDLDKMMVTKEGQLIELTPLELKLLFLLFIHLGKVVRRNTILDTIWEITGNDVDDHTVTVYMKRIREKLEEDIITTVKGIGYRIDEK